MRTAQQRVAEKKAQWKAMDKFISVLACFQTLAMLRRLSECHRVVDGVTFYHRLRERDQTLSH